MRGWAEDFLGPGASSRCQSNTLSDPAQSMRIKPLRIVLRIASACPEVTIPRPRCAQFLRFLCFLALSCAIHAFQLPPAHRGLVSQRAKVLSSSNADGAPGAHGGGGGAPGNVCDWAYWEKELEHWSTEDLLRSELADEFVRILQTRPGWQRILAAVEGCYQAGATQVLLCGPSVRDPDHGHGIVPDTAIEDGIEIAIRVDSGIDLAVSGLDGGGICRAENNVMEVLFDETAPTVHVTIDVIHFYLDEQRQRQHEQSWLQEIPRRCAIVFQDFKEGMAGISALWPEQSQVVLDLEESLSRGDYATVEAFFGLDRLGPGVDGSRDQDLLAGSLWISRCGVVRPARNFANLAFEIGSCEQARGNEPGGKADE